MSSEFEKLAAELEVLAKAQPATNEDKVLAAAKEAGVDTDQIGETKEVDADGIDGPDKDEDEDDEVLGKSFRAVSANGKSVKAYDATDLIKSLDARIQEVKSTVDADNQHLSKSLTLVADMLKSQSEQIDVLQKALINMGKLGTGRKAVLTVNEKPEAGLMKSAPDAMSKEAFMLKASAAFSAGRISGKDLTVCDVSLRQGEAIDSGLVSKILSN